MSSSKLMTLEEAISTYIQNADLVGMGGLSIWKESMNACREIEKLVIIKKKV